jgi:ATP-binding cassette, subfamily B, bacterial
MRNIFKIVSYTKIFWKWYLVMGIFVILMSLLSLATPLLMKQIVDSIVKQISGQKIDLNSVIIFLILIILTDVSITILSSIGGWIGDILSVKLNTYLTKDFYRHLLSLDIGFYDREITGQIVNKMYRGIDSITDFMNNILNNFLPFFLTAIVTIILLAHYSIVVAMLLAILFPAYILISHKSSLAWQKHEGEKNIVSDISQGRVFESINGIRVVKAFAAEVIEIGKFISSRKKIEKYTVTQTREWHIYDFYRRLTLNVILFAILYYIVYWTFHRRFSIGEMTLLVQLVQQARFPLFAMSFILGQIQLASAGSKDFFSILETGVKIKDIQNAKLLRLSKHNQAYNIEFSHVYFTYEHGKQVLSDASFSIMAGEKLALVGESGQGKSTTVNLLLRFYEPQKGLIKINHMNISGITLNSLHENIAVVFQESLLFSGTIAENIRYGNENATEGDLIAAAKAANAYEFIKLLPDDFNSTVGERGVKLSGGQKQRIAIARAILKDAPIIILDEATSSLDSRSEIEVQRGLERLMSGRTSIIIAHRLSTIAGADHIVVLAKGQVAQYGTPRELLQNSQGLYYQMINLQQKLLTATPQEKEDALRKFDLVG